MVIEDSIVKKLVESLASEFMNLYREYVEPFEYDELLTNGYCLYFALLLKQLLPEGQVLSTGDSHYIFLYNNHYYDGTGELFVYDSIIRLFGVFKSINSLKLVDVQEEIDMGEILDRDHKTKEFVWGKIGNLLLQFGNQELERLQEKSTLKM